jgi:ParB/RepB/Spo0J family partition protein
MIKIVDAELDRIVPNPFRMLDKYPYREEKLAALQSSIKETGFWSGVIARRHGDKFQLAFGHHRVEAARLVGLETVPLDVRELTDEQMLQLMARENLEDYRTSFLELLTTWEAAADYLSRMRDIPVKPIAVAKFLGWVTIRGEGKQQGEAVLNTTARATSPALDLIRGGYNTYADFEGLSVRTAQAIVGRGRHLMKRLDPSSPYQTPSTPERIEKRKKQIGEAVAETAEQYREGVVAQKDLLAKVDTNVWEYAREAERESPLFTPFCNRLSDSIDKMLNTDIASEKLRKISKNIKHLVTEEDRNSVKRIIFQLAVLPERADKWQRRLLAALEKPVVVVKQEKVVAVKQEKVVVKVITQKAGEG